MHERLSFAAEFRFIGLQSTLGATTEIYTPFTESSD